MRVAFFGGSFDPPHRGHLAIAHAALERFRLDRVLFAPVGAQPLKRDTLPANFNDRAAMVRLAIAGEPRFVLSLADAPRGDEKPNYTIDTLALVSRELAPDDELYLLLGADSFLTLPKWHRAAELLLFCPVIVAARPGFSLAEALSALPEGITVEGSEGTASQRLSGPDGRTSTLYMLPDLAEDVSATTIRQALTQGSRQDSHITPDVRAYIDQHGLYRGGEKTKTTGPHPAS